MELDNAIASILMSPKNNYGLLSIEEEKLLMSADIETQVYKNFVLADLHTSDLALNPNATFQVKKTAFNIVNATFKQTYNRSIDNLLVLSEEFHTGADSFSPPTDRCLHYLINEIGKVVNTIQHINSLPKFQHNLYIFLPYMKQLQQIILLFKDDLCCKKLVDQYSSQLKDLLNEADKYISIVKTLNRRIEVINVFLENPIYCCNICQESSNSKNFLKPNECCGYQMCSMCYANLWKYANLYPVCPVCKTSFKTSNASQTNKPLQPLLHQSIYEE